EQGIARRQSLVGVGAVMDAAQPFQLFGVILGQVGQVGDDQGVLVDQGGGVVEQAVGQGGHVPVFNAEMTNEAFFGGVEILDAASDGTGDVAEVDVVGDDQSGNHVGEEASSSGVGEGRCQSSGEGVQSLTDAGREVSGSHRWASFRRGRCNSLREEAFLFPL